MTNQSIGKIVIVLGLVLVLGGAVMYFFGDKLKWIGHLPGDIKMEKGNTTIYLPITSMILLSVLINVVFRLLNYLK